MCFIQTNMSRALGRGKISWPRQFGRVGPAQRSPTKNRENAWWDGAALVPDARLLIARPKPCGGVRSFGVWPLTAAFGWGGVDLPRNVASRPPSLGKKRRRIATLQKSNSRAGG